MIFFLHIGLYRKEPLRSNDLFIYLFWGNEKRWCNMTANFSTFLCLHSQYPAEVESLSLFQNMTLVNLLYTAFHPGCIVNLSPVFLGQIPDPRHPDRDKIGHWRWTSEWMNALRTFTWWNSKEKSHWEALRKQQTILQNCTVNSHIIRWTLSVIHLQVWVNRC